MYCSTGMKKELIMSLIELAKKHDLKKLILFGSRARGDFYRTSDIDLAICGGNRVEFAVDVEEETMTLLKYDVVDLDGVVQKELRQSIEKEGIILYEKV